MHNEHASYLRAEQLSSIKTLTDVSLVSKANLMIPGVPVCVETPKR